jgi:hypothetical protein
MKKLFQFIKNLFVKVDELEQKVEKMSSLGLSKEDLKNLDIQVYWRNRLTNSLTPLTLYNGGSANIRLLFRRIHE